MASCEQTLAFCVLGSILVLILSAGVDCQFANPSLTTTSPPQTASASTVPASTAQPQPSPPPDTKPCASFPVPSQGPSLPQLDNQFQAHIEATFIQKGYTVTIVEHYDWVNNRGAVFKMAGGVQSHWLYDFDHFKTYLIKGVECSLVEDNKDQNSFKFFNFTQPKAGGTAGHIAGVADLFNFGSQYSEIYVGEDEVRGIPVDHWVSCLEWDRYNAQFQLHYYFSKQNYTSSVGQRQIPVRAMLKGKTNGASMRNFDHVYDFVSYIPGPQRHQYPFQVPQGVVCPGLVSDKEFPTLPDIFVASVEIVHPGANYTSVRQEVHSFPLNLSRFDVRPAKGDPLEANFGGNPLHIIHDYGTGLEYIIDPARENCTVSVLPETAPDATSDDLHHVLMKHGEQLFDLDKFDFLYQGKRDVRGIPCEVWGSVTVDYPANGTTTTVEVYYTQDHWTVEVGLEGEKQVMVGMWMRQTSQGVVLNEQTSHMYSYTDGAVGLELFDIQLCYSRQAYSIHLLLKLTGSYDDLMVGAFRLHAMKAAVRSQLATAAGVEPIRITDIWFYASDSSNVDVWFTLLEKPSQQGSVAVPIVSLTMEEAYDQLKSKIKVEEKDADSTPLVISVDFQQVKQDIPVVPNSLKTDQEVMDPRPAPAGTDNKGRGGGGYSSGSMAGLAFAMMIIGGVVGVVAAYFLWRRRIPHIPYHIQD